MQWYKDNDNDDDNDDEATAGSKQSGISHTAEILNLTANKYRTKRGQSETWKDFWRQQQQQRYIEWSHTTDSN